MLDTTKVGTFYLLAESDLENDELGIKVAVDGNEVLNWIMTLEQATLLVHRVSRAARINP